MESKVYCLVCLIVSWPACLCVCEFPENLRGRFISNDNNGTLFFNGTHVDGFKILSSSCSGCNRSVSPTIMECLENEGNRYIVRSQNITTNTSGGVDVSNAFACWYLTQVDTSVWTYYQGPRVKHRYYGEYLYVGSSPPTKDQVCDLPVPLPAQRLRVFIASDTQQPAASTCPSQLMGTFVMNTSTTSRFDVCSSEKRQQIKIVDPLYLQDNSSSDSTTLNCIHSVREADVTYVLTSVATNQSSHFVCFAFVSSDDHLNVTQKDNDCDRSSNTSSHYFVLTAESFCPLEQHAETTPDTSEETTTDTDLVIALGVVIPVVVVVIASVIIGCLLCKKKQIGPWKAGHQTHAEPPNGTQILDHQEPVWAPAQTSN